jgi:hypothetical protein
MAVKKSFSFDKSDQQKPASEMTRFDVIIDFFMFLGTSAGYIIQVCRLIILTSSTNVILIKTRFLKDKENDDDNK